MTTDDSAHSDQVLKSLIASAQGDSCSPNLSAKILHRVRYEEEKRRRQSRLLFSAGVLSVAAAAALSFFVSSARQSIPVSPERQADSAAVQPPPPALPQLCANPVVAEGRVPLFDDFEDQDARAPQREGRRGLWELITDRDMNKEGPFPAFPQLLPEAERTAENQRAMNIAVARLRDWGASLEYRFQPEHCYDASAYLGMRFRAKGGTRLQVAARQPEVIPVANGGSCETDCYISHLKLIDLNHEWTEYELRWEDFIKRGYDSKALDPSRLHSLQFAVQSEDTPADLWIDDVSFISADEE